MTAIGSHDTALPAAGGVALGLLRRPEVAEAWDASSALPEMSVGALACHLGRQLVVAADLLVTPTDLAPLDSADAHYERAAWVTSTSPHDPVNDRSADDDEARSGPAALVDRASDAHRRVTALLRSGEACDLVPVPWQGWALRRSDFLLTRMLELVVHSDDLAVSIRVPTPEFPVDVFRPVLDLLTRLAARRHGQAALISTLARRERAREVWAF